MYKIINLEKWNVNCKLCQDRYDKTTSHEVSSRIWAVYFPTHIVCKNYVLWDKPLNAVVFLMCVCSSGLDRLRRLNFCQTSSAICLQFYNVGSRTVQYLSYFFSTLSKIFIRKYSCSPLTCVRQIRKLNTDQAVFMPAVTRHKRLYLVLISPRQLDVLVE
jgi:hypothetical protein